ncbi:MAG: hypothetical protein JWQ81_8550 [Amycolatopsis sp.]|jgi:hypothetical protein|uniref:hypothetical protein n=1 Tax=Amycolatopsis sp. TaxID=37632 RepID=UPI00261687AF|nr:hypothetical protein [Amycolatopsis sp.]MCU1687811.1 hypothetical protein [Amycolatopsis sp.]
MMNARELTRYRAALALLVALTVPLLVVAVPIVIQLAESNWRPRVEQALVAVSIILGWWASFVAVWLTEVRLHESRQRATLKH